MDAWSIDFRWHAVRHGSDDAGRVDFQRMLSGLVGLQHPSATEIRPAPGDWGIDVMVGDLTDSILIWQSKYFYSTIGPSQKDQIRKSFASAMENAAREGYSVDAWTLCVACDLSTQERQWWDSKVRQWKRVHEGLQIQLWDATRLRRMLSSPDATSILAQFYGTSTAVPSVPHLPPFVREATPDYDGALFIRQLDAAEIRELDGQRLAYFNADLLVRDIHHRAVPEQLAAIDEVDGTLLANWEDAFADPTTAPHEGDYAASARRLFAAVMRTAQTLPSPPELPLRAVHQRGLMHRVVEQSRAGWVHDWRQVAAAHAESAEPAPEATEDTAEAVDEPQTHDA